MNDRIKILLGTVLIMLITSSCTSDFEEINTAPGTVIEDRVDPKVLFTGAQKDFLYDIPDLDVIDAWMGYQINQAAGNVFLDPVWSWSYDNYLINNEEVIRLTAEDPSRSNQNAIARIMKVAMFHPVTDAFGDVPYSEALQSVENNNPTPKYDTQENIYKGMLNNLQEAASELEESSSQKTFGSADLIYGGNVNMWRRYANSLRLRLAMRVRYADEQLAQQQISDVIDKPLISSNSQNATFTTADSATSETGNRNPLFNSSIGAGQPDWAGYTITSLMNGRDDPRRPIYFHIARDTVSGYRGRPVALNQDQKGTDRYTTNTSAFYGELFTNSVYQIKAMQYAEVQFLKAEAYLTGLAAGNAQAAFQEGIRASMNLYGVSPSEINTYISNSGTLPADNEEALREIIIQKYFANFGLSEEAWAEFRRTGYPRQFTGGLTGRTDGNIPRRKTYPDVEFSINQSHAEEAASRYSNGDELMSRMWWDAKEGLPYEHPAQGTFPPPQDPEF